MDFWTGEVHEGQKTLDGGGDKEQMGGARMKHESAPARPDEVKQHPRLQRGKRGSPIYAEFQFIPRARIGENGEADKRLRGAFHSNEVKLSGRRSPGRLSAAPDMHLSARCRDFGDG